MTRDNTNRTVLARIKHYDADSKSYKLHSLMYEEDNHARLQICLRRGGIIRLFPKVLRNDTPREVRQELFEKGMFRQYKTQGLDEPCCHMLLHVDATDCFEEEQPGYRYQRTTFKARPLKWFRNLAKLSKEMAALCNIDKWTIGVNPVLYRDGKDRIGDHADDAQEETLILAVLVESPPEARRVVVRPFSTLELEDGDEKIELFMKPGDAYSMDGRMQKSYSHCVPRVNKHVGEGNRRLAIIFRTGKEMWFEHDSGRPCQNLAPRPEKTTFRLGNGAFDLIEGACYARMEMYRTGAHSFLQRGVSGNKDDGCDAIVVSGKRADCQGEDQFENLYYVADMKSGARPLLTSYIRSQSIRVFRSSDYFNVYRAPKSKSVGSTMYRYDGLYSIQNVVDHASEGKKQQRHTFFLERLNAPFNEINCREYRKHCESQHTLLPATYREFLLWWETSRIPELLMDREALYSHFVKQKPIAFLSSHSKELAVTFFKFGMEEVVLRYKQILALMEMDAVMEMGIESPIVSEKTVGRLQRKRKLPLRYVVEVDH